MKQTFTDQVLYRCGRAFRITQEIRKVIVQQMPRLEELGYTISDAYHTVRCYEEVNPKLSEAFALRQMELISKKYRGTSI